MGNFNADNISDILKVLADPNRLRILKLLNEQTSCKSKTANCHSDDFGQPDFLCVNALCENLEISQSAVSQHLRILRQVGLVRVERVGAFARYSLNYDTMKKHALQVFTALRTIGFEGEI